MATPQSYFSEGSGSVFFNQIGCSGDESQLSECPFYEGSSEKCSSHTNDAGVICRGLFPLFPLETQETPSSWNLQT